MYPNDLLYTAEHEWIKIDGTIATVGITHFAQRELGDIVYVDITTKGKTLKQNEVFGSVEAVKTVSDLFMPLSGTIIEINTALDQTPDAVNNDPYNTGWMIKMEITHAEEVSKLMDSQSYEASL